MCFSVSYFRQIFCKSRFVDFEQLNLLVHLLFPVSGCLSEGVVVEVAVEDITGVVEDLTGVVEDLTVVEEEDSVVEEVEEAALTDSKIMVPQNMLSVRCGGCNETSFRYSFA